MGLLSETSPGGQWPDGETPRTCQPQRDGRLSPLEQGRPQRPLSSATRHPKNTLRHLRQVTAPPWVSSSPCWSKGETYSSHRFKTPGRRVPGAPQGTDTLICSGAHGTEGTRLGDRTDAHSAGGWPCLLLKDKAASVRGRCQLSEVQRPSWSWPFIWGGRTQAGTTPDVS